jgi:hypothetical protein
MVRRVPVGEVFHQQRYVFPPLAQRRHMNREDIQPVKQVAPEATGPHVLGEVAIRRRYQSHVYTQRLVAADSLEFTLLQHPQEHYLRFLRHFSDFVQKQSAAVSLLKAAFSSADSACECASLMAEQLGGQQSSWYGGAVDLDQRAMCPRRPPVDGARNQLLAGAGLAGDQHCCSRSGHLLDRLQDAAQRLRIPYDSLKPGRLSELRSEGDVLFGELVAQLANLFVRHRVGHRDADRARHIRKHGKLFISVRYRFHSRERRDADYLAPHDKQDGRVGPDSGSRKVELMFIPVLLGQQVVTSADGHFRRHRWIWNQVAGR